MATVGPLLQEVGVVHKALLWRQVLPYTHTTVTSAVTKAILVAFQSVVEAESPFVFRLSEVHSKHKGREQM